MVSVDYGGRHGLDRPRAFRELGKQQVISLILPENTASVAAAVRCGERRIGETEMSVAEGKPIAVWREEWAEREASGQPPS